MGCRFHSQARVHQTPRTASFPLHLNTCPWERESASCVGQAVVGTQAGAWPQALLHLARQTAHILTCLCVAPPRSRFICISMGHVTSAGQ